MVTAPSGLQRDAAADDLNNVGPPFDFVFILDVRHDYPCMLLNHTMKNSMTAIPAKNEIMHHSTTLTASAKRFRFSLIINMFLLLFSIG